MYAYQPYIKFQTTWSCAVDSIPIKYYNLYFLLCCLIYSIFLVYYSWDSPSYYWKKCFNGKFNSIFCFGVSAVSFGFPYLFFVFLKVTFFCWKLLNIFWGTNFEPASFSNVFLIKLLKTILFSFCENYNGYFIVSISSFSSSALILLNSWLILLSFSWSILWACCTFFMKGAFFSFKKIGG